MGHNNFGDKSSKGKTYIPQRAPGGFTEGQLHAHDHLMDVIDEAGETGLGD